MARDKWYERAKKGAEFLDGASPYWHEGIVLRTLDLASPCNCVLGQLRGEYTKGKEYYNLSRHEAEKGGFALLGTDNFDNYRSLTRAWGRLILARLKATISKG